MTMVALIDAPLIQIDQRHVPFFLANRWVRIDARYDDDTDRGWIIVDGVEVWYGVPRDRFDQSLDLVLAVVERLGKMEQ